MNVKSYLIEKDILRLELKKSGFDTNNIVNFFRCLDEHDIKLSKEHRFF